MIKFIHNNLEKFLPKKVFLTIKSKYRFLRSKYHHKINEEDFFKILDKDLGIKKGSVVFIHSSINRLFIDFSIPRLVKILQEVVGKEGTLLFACYQSELRAEDYLKTNPVFNVKKTPTKMGLLPEYVRRLKTSHRSLHPTHSIVGIGKLAEELTKDHHKSIYPHGKESPFYKITQHNGVILGLGVKAEDSLTFVHTVEDILEDEFPVKTKNKKIATCKVIDKNKNEITVSTLTPHIRIGFRNLKKYLSRYIPTDICYNINVNGSDFFRADSEKLLEFMVKDAKSNRTIYTKKAFK